MRVTIAVDAMGGDHGLSVTVPAVSSFLATTPDAQVVMVGLAEPLEAALASVDKTLRSRITVRAASEIVEMDEPPADALRRKKDSSMRVAIDLIKSGEAQACVSAGNTGALMAIGKFVLKTLRGIDRPAIATQLPNTRGVSTMLDLGANVNCTPEQMLQFAIMGSALSAAIEGNDNPTVGLLNIGEEETKGNEMVKEAAELLRRSGLNFYGNVEGNDIYKGTTDVVVCDGFVGNVALKTSEGLVQMLYQFLKDEYTRNWRTRLAALISYRVLKSFKSRLDPRRFNGATLVGLRGVVIKSHGSADELAFECALRKAYQEVAHGMLDRIAQRIEAVSAQLPSVALPEADRVD
ncbi:MAG: phosphate acyltransferase PlsX [Proteobacteria bacterium]|nr:phosphate acyltransferase PlsX [Pseudomonadota bacterium]MCL2308136.1 phosphate acyltransferase PlsX [Pseudomonadota bacterium]